MIDDRQQPADSLQVEDDKKSSKVLLEVINDALAVFEPYLTQCKEIDQYYSRMASKMRRVDVNDPDFDLFWASEQILRVAIYSRPPRPLASPMFDDRDMTVTTTADLLERCLTSAFKQDDYNQVMLGTRDDLSMTNRGVQWVRYESKDGQRLCYEDLDRCDFVHDPARKWREVGWVARRAWMTLDEMKKRFPDVPLDVLTQAAIPERKDRDENYDHSRKAGVWEVWSRTDKKVYWVVEGVETILDEKEPFLDLRDFFPCPRPAYGTTKPRSLIPIPDFTRYASLLEQVDDMTGRIYELLDEVRLRGFYNGAGDRGTAINKLFNDRSTAMQLIGLDGGMMQGAAGPAIEWLPIDMIATTIQGLLEARSSLIQDYYQLSGISDIMRGSTDAGETLGAQRLKQQNGSVRVRDRQNELERIAADAAAISAEIMAKNFTHETLLEMSQMKIRKRSAIDGDIKKTQDAARKELEGLGDQAEQMTAEAQASGQPLDPEQAKQAEAQFNQAQQQILAKYEPILSKLGKEVALEDVMAILRDGKARNFVIEIETDSTILTDEIAAKQSASEFYSAFTSGLQGLVGVAAMGPEAVKMATEVFKMTLAPYRPSRAVVASIDDFVDAAPEIAQRMQAEAGDGGAEQGAEALAAAEMEKAKAQMAKVQADATLKEAELQQRMTQMQIDVQEKQARMQLDNGKLQLQASKQEQEFAAKMADMDAKQNLMQAQTAEILAKIGLDVRKQDLEEYKAAEETQARQVDQVMRAEGEAFNQSQAIRQDQRADRGEDRADRQAMSERQPQGGNTAS